MQTETEQKQYLITGGVPLTKFAPKYFQLGDPLAGDDNVKLARDTHRLVQEEHGDHPLLRVKIGDDGTLMGSNPFSFFKYGLTAEKLYGPGLRLVDVRVVRDVIEQARKGDDKLLGRLRQFYEVCGIVASEAQGPNEQYKKYLLNQLDERGIQLEFPIVFDRLKVMKDNDFPGHLRFDLADEENVAHHDPDVPQYGGLRWLYRGRDLYLDAYYVNLPLSVGAGRVSFLMGAAPQNSAALEARVIKAVREAFSGNR